MMIRRKICIMPKPNFMCSMLRLLQFDETAFHDNFHRGCSVLWNPDKTTRAGCHYGLRQASLRGTRGSVFCTHIRTTLDVRAGQLWSLGLVGFYDYNMLVPIITSILASVIISRLVSIITGMLASIITVR